MLLISLKMITLIGSPYQTNNIHIILFVCRLNQ